MDVFNLASELEEIERIRRFNFMEATTMDTISFLPTQLGVVKSKVKALSKRKWKWGLEILEGDDGEKDVRIEDALRIIVPKEHWEQFQEMFVGELDGDSYLNLKSLLNEAMADELKDLQMGLKPALSEMYNDQRFSSLDKTIEVWQGRFGVTQFITTKNNVAVTFENKGRDIQQLYGRLIRVYKEDKGGLEMLHGDIAENRPLSAFDVFKNYDYLYGTRVVSEFLDITLVFEAVIDTTFMISQSILIEDEDVLEEVEDQVRSVKRVGNVLYPTGEQFDVDFFNSLYTIVEEVAEESEKEER